MNPNVGKTSGELTTTANVRRSVRTRVSSGGIDDINPEDIIYGEYSSKIKNIDSWIDLVYLDDDILRTFSGAVSSHHPVVEELKILLRSDDVFYLVPIKEVPFGFAFKRTDIIDIKVTSVVQGNDKHAPSCVWRMLFKDRNTRTLEAEYQSYFAYGNTVRPAGMTNAAILDKVFSQNDKGNH